MTDTDILTRLRGHDAIFTRIHYAKDGCLEYVHGPIPICQEAADEIEQLRAERDEARRIACEMEERVGCDDSGCPKNGLARDHAKRRGWDCYKENADG